MSRRYLLPLALGALLLGGVPALADANGSTEVKTVDRSCGAPADNRYSPPTSSDCRTNGVFDKNKTYKSQYNSNDVKCGDKNTQTPANPTGVRVYNAGDPAAMKGGVSVCSDGSGAAPAPVQGRAGAGGNASDGATVYADGDKDNQNETAQGFAVVNAKPQPAPPTVRCGKAHAQGGKSDTDYMQAHDTQAECG